MSKRRIIAVISLVLMVALWNYMGNVEVPKSALLFGLLLIATLMAGSVQGELRYGTGQMISPTVKGSYLRDSVIKIPVAISEKKAAESPGENCDVQYMRWLVFPVGSVANEGWNLYSTGGEGTVVVPDGCLYNMGRNAMLFAAPKPVQDVQLPPEVRRVITGLKGYGPPYYLARTPVNPKLPLEHQKVDVGRLEANAEAYSIQVNLYEDALLGKYKWVDKEVGRIMGAAGRVKPTIMERLKEAVMGKEKAGGE